MKIRLLILLAVFSFSHAFAQDDAPGFKQSTSFPAFELQQADNSVFTPSRLKKNVPTVVIFFSPGCDHCLHQMDWMMKRSADLKKYQFVMATYQPVEELAEFNKKYNLAKHPNFHTGRDSKYYLPPFYQIRNFPYLAFYDKRGKLITTFEGNLSVDNMIKKLNRRN
jgi:cytochrome oxidase Cu insertion factor (SCO1/SenC/PrrC family)